MQDDIAFIPNDVSFEKGEILLLSYLKVDFTYITMHDSKFLLMLKLNVTSQVILKEAFLHVLGYVVADQMCH